MILRTIAVTAVLTLSAVLSACDTTGKGSSATPISTRVSLPILSADHLVSDMVDEETELTADIWLQSAKTYFEANDYTRALRAANEALYIEPNTTEARKIVLLSTIRIAQQNSAIYHDEALITDSDKDDIKEGLTTITSLINAS
ncbi:tetratricopeptide repeat protein [Psychrobacter aestuarii]|uniref:Tetratricopeptide repeat protein n=1 Tax=Psychrobacter aestuarii TaxID=556327 RepID=A0ABP3FIS9_9GAMM|nr:tetratricopeptide repeat protein [Psychrobacter aestuarii]